MADTRNGGNPNTSAGDREGGRIGQARVPDDLPPQGTVSGDLSSLLAGVAYRIGPPTRPPITHDNGFLALGRRTPTAGDYAKKAVWKAKLEAGEALRPDLTDALGAYRHFLEGGGKPRTFSYERYVQNDRSGRTTLKNAVLNVQWGAIQLWKTTRTRSFSLTGSAIPCGGSSVHYPYPATENWQKAIGGHQIWLSGDVTVTGGTVPDPSDNKAGPHQQGGFAFTIARTGAIVVRPGDMLSKYSQALHRGDRSRVGEYARLVSGKLQPIANPNLISVGETLYHAPTYTFNQAASVADPPRFSLALTLHAEDRYNFNPGAADIATGIPDEDNGIFEMTGLAHQYDHFSTLTRSISWTGLLLGVGEAINASHERQRQPSNNRRARNRV